MIFGSMVIVTVGDSVAGRVAVNVSDTGAGVFAAWVNATATVSVRSTVEDALVGVFNGSGLLVVVAGRFGVKEGSGESCVVGVESTRAAG